MPRPKKKKTTKKYKDIYDFIANASEDEFARKLALIEAVNIQIAGFMILERTKVKGFMRLQQFLLNH